MYLLVFCSLLNVVGRFLTTDSDLWTSDFFLHSASELFSTDPSSYSRPHDQNQEPICFPSLDVQHKLNEIEQVPLPEPQPQALEEEASGLDFGWDVMFDDYLSNLGALAAPADEPNSSLIVCTPPAVGLPTSAGGLVNVNCQTTTSSNQTSHRQDIECDQNCSSYEGVSAMLNSEDGILAADKIGDHTKFAFPGNGNKAGEDTNCLAPQIRMSFSSEKEAFEFYNKYALQSGFRVRKAKVQRLSDGTISRRHLYCSKEGFRSTKQSMKTTKYKRRETRTGCQARIQLNVEEGNWVISKAILEHNHDLEIKSIGRQIADPCAFNSRTRSVCETNNEVGKEKEVGAEKNNVGFNSSDDRGMNDRVEELTEVCNGPLNLWETKLERMASDIIHKVEGQSRCLMLVQSCLEEVAKKVENILETQPVEDV